MSSHTAKKRKIVSIIYSVMCFVCLTAVAYGDPSVATSSMAPPSELQHDLMNALGIGIFVAIILGFGWYLTSRKENEA